MPSEPTSTARAAFQQLMIDVWPSLRTKLAEWGEAFEKKDQSGFLTAGEQIGFIVAQNINEANRLGREEGQEILSAERDIFAASLQIYKSMIENGEAWEAYGSYERLPLDPGEHPLVIRRVAVAHARLLYAEVMTQAKDAQARQEEARAATAQSFVSNLDLSDMLR